MGDRRRRKSSGSSARNEYLPIADHGVVGNCRTLALIGLDGGVSFMCYPRFDSPTIFASILDAEKGGSFSISPQQQVNKVKQRYWPSTTILLTMYFADSGVAELTDYMPMFVHRRESPGFENVLVRSLHVVRGEVAFNVVLDPQFDYARVAPTSRIVKGKGIQFLSKDLNIEVVTNAAGWKQRSGGRGVATEIKLAEGDRVTFLLRPCSSSLPAKDIADLPSETESVLFKRTMEYWHNWVSRSSYRGRWREMVLRSALTLKLLTSIEHGSVIAAGTTSLPENIGGPRNWDYRFTWIRDSAFVVYGLMRIGFTEEADRFIEWIEARCREMNPDGSLQIMYGLDGRKDLHEEELKHLSGYRNSAPVRIGNGAADQLQLDIYGELMDAIYLANKHGKPISYDFWQFVRRLCNYVVKNWTRPDEGIWEVRGGKQHFIYSKMMCWVALDRGLRLADKRSFPCPERDKWIKTRDAIYEEVMTKGWSEKKQYFTQAYGNETLDASVLTMPLTFFLTPSDPRMLATLRAISRSPKNGGLVHSGLVYRYDTSQVDDGTAGGEEGTFSICTFWMIEAMTRAGVWDKTMLNSARVRFEAMLGYANHLGLYAEEIGVDGQQLGNFPQAFTHLALISSAYNLDRALNNKSVAGSGS